MAIDNGPRLVSLATNLINVNENTPTGVVQVTINRTGPLDGLVDVTYRAVNITAIANWDFVDTNNTVRFLDGESEKVISIPIINDVEVEGPERFSFVLELAEGAGLGAPRTADILIIDDEEPSEPPLPEESETYGYAVTKTDVLSNIERPVGVAWLPDDPTTMLVGRQAGIISIVKNGQELATPLLDISGRVNFIADRGLTDFAFDPDFANFPYLYVTYVYDPPETALRPPGFSFLDGPDGAGNRPARVSRFEVTLDANGVPSVNPNSEVVLIGANGTWGNISGPNVNSTLVLDQPPSGIDPVTGENLPDYIAVDSTSHAPGSIGFGPDGALYVTIGDGTSFNAVDVRSLRVQDIDNLSGKVLRVNRFTGDGLADNPFWTGDPDANASKVYQLGLRNGFRMEIDDQTGKVWIGDVGWYLWESIESGGPGANFGWPFFEGGDGVLTPHPTYSQLPEGIAFLNAVATGQITLTAPYRSFGHDPVEPGPQFVAIILGEIYRSDVYPLEFKNDLFFADFLSGAIYTVDVNDPTRTERILTQVPTVSDMSIGPDGKVYVVSNFGGTVQRLDIPGDLINPPAGPPQITFSQASTATFQQDRTDSFTTAPPAVGQYRAITGTEMAIAGVAASTTVEMFAAADLLSIGVAGGPFGAVNNLYVTDGDGVSFFASPFRSVEVVSTGGPNFVILDRTQRGRVEFGDSRDILVVAVEADGGTALGLANTFTANLGRGNDQMLVQDSSALTRLVIDAGEGNDVVVTEGLGNVRLTGGKGNDVMILTAADHTVVIRPGDGQDIVGEFTFGRDTIEFVGVAPQSVRAEAWFDAPSNNSGTLVRYGATDDFVLLVGTPFSQFSQADLIFV